MAQGMLGGLPPGLRGMLAAEQMAQQRSQNELAQGAGILSLQNQMQMQPIRREMAQLQLQQARTPKQNWKEAAIKQPDGSVKRGYVDISSPNPEATFRPLGVEPVKKEFVNGVPTNPYTQTEPIADPNKPFSVGLLGQPQPNTHYQQYELSKAQAGRPQVTTNILPPQKAFENEDKLRNDYNANPLVKASSEMQNAFNLIDAAYQRPSAANDLAMATKYMKILDPTSVVRESEFALAVNATGLLDKVQNYAASVLEGKKLNPNQRKDFYDSAKAINDAFQKQRGEVDRQYSEMTTGYGLNPQNVIPALRRRATDKGEFKVLGKE